MGATGRDCEKKSITRTGQDRTTKKSQKRNISHIWGKAPRKAIWHMGVCPRGSYTWAKFDV